MKRSTKTISIIFVFFLIITIVIVGRSMIGNHFKKKFSKRPPPGIIVTEVIEKEFSEQIETYGTAISKKSKTFKIKKDEVTLSSFKDKTFSGEIDFVSSRINADTRSLLSRIKVKNENLELISGSLLEVRVKFDLRNSLSVPDTSVMIEGDKSYVYKISAENIANKTEVKTGLRGDSNIEIISGLAAGDIIVAEGLKKVRPRGKIKPINK